MQSLISKEMGYRHRLILRLKNKKEEKKHEKSMVEGKRSLSDIS